MKHSQPAAKMRGDYLDAVLQTTHEPFIVLDADYRVWTANKSFYEVFQTESQNVLGLLVFDLGEGSWDTPELHRLLDDISSGGSEISDHDIELALPHIGSRSLLVNARPFTDEETGEASILLALKDVTAMKRAEEEFHQFIYKVSHDLQQPVSKIITISELLKEKLKTLDGTEKDYLVRMYEAGRQAKTFIDTLTRDSISNLKSIQWPTSKK